MGNSPPAGLPSGGKYGGARWAPAVAAGLLGATLYLDPALPLGEGARTLLLACVSAGLAWALAPRGSFHAGEGG